MRDVVAIIAAATRLRDRRAPFLVATVVRIEGSSYRRPGARLIATSEGRMAGSISGGCLERDLLRTGLWRTQHGPVLVRYDSREPDDGEPVLGCGGIVEVLLEQGTAGTSDDPLAPLVEALSSEQPAALATVFGSTDPDIPLGTRWMMTREQLAAPRHDRREGMNSAPDAVATACSSVISGDRSTSLSLTTPRGVIEVLIEPVRPPPHLFVCGAGADAVPVVVMARHLGWRVTVWGAFESFASRSQFMAIGATVESDLAAIGAQVDAASHAMAIVMGHNISRDREALRMLLASQASYIGVLGPRHRTASLAAELPGEVLTDPRVHAPVGLDLGAETPEEISVAVTSEMLAHLRGASHESLRQRASIHRGDPPVHGTTRGNG